MTEESETVELSTSAGDGGSSETGPPQSQDSEPGATQTAELPVESYCLHCQPSNLKVEVDNENGVPAKDPESGEVLHFLFNIVTTQTDEGALKLAGILSHVHAAGLRSHTYDAMSGAGDRITRLGATDRRLLEYAASFDLYRPFVPEIIKEECEKKKIVIENPDTAQGRSWYPPYEALSGPFEIDFERLYAPLTDSERMSFFRLLVSGDSNFEGAAKGCGLDIAELESSKEDNAFCLAVFPSHDEAAKKTLEDKWMPFDLPWNLPIEDIKNYFGEEIGFYFGFLGHLASGLLPIVPFAVVAQVVSLVQLASSSRTMAANSVFAFFGTVSFMLVLASWRYRQSSLIHLWGCSSKGQAALPRPGYKGLVMKDPTTGRLVIDFPTETKAFRARATLAASGTMMAVLLGTVISIFVYKAALARAHASTLELMIPAVLNAIQVAVYGVVYMYIAKLLTEFENHKTSMEHNSQLFKKLIVFYAVNNFAVLFYIAFIKNSVEGCLDAVTQSKFCGLELCIQVALVFIVNDFVSRITNSLVVPKLKQMYKAWAIGNDDSIAGEHMGVVEQQYRLLTSYDPEQELVLDYIELFVQFGYLTLFGAAFPIAVLFAYVTNFVETRTDGYKLLHQFRRVLPNRVAGIGEPLEVFTLILYVSVPVNCGLAVYTFTDEPGSFWPLPPVWMWIALVICLYGVLQVLQAALPSVPPKTAIQTRRQHFVYERCVLGMEDDVDASLTLDETMVGISLDAVRKEKEKALLGEEPTLTRTKWKPSSAARQKSDGEAGEAANPGIPI